MQLMKSKSNQKFSPVYIRLHSKLLGFFELIIQINQVEKELVQTANRFRALKLYGAKFNI